MSIKAFFPNGRLCVRKTKDGVIIFGVLHFPDGFRPEGERGCLVAVMGDGLAALPVAGVPQNTSEARVSAMSWPTMQNWQLFDEGVGGHQMFEARYIGVFRRSNGWAFEGVAKTDPFVNALPEAHRASPHYWADIEQGGRLRAIDPPVATVLEGLAVGQILRNLCVWPDGDGVLHRPGGLSYAVVGDGPRGRKIEFSPAATAENFKLACRMAIDLAKSLFEEELAVIFEAQGVEVQVVQSDDPEVQYALWERQIQARQVVVTEAELSDPTQYTLAAPATLAASVRVRTSDAIGVELDFAVGLCEGVKGLVLRDGALHHPPAQFSDEERYAPSIDWDQGGPIVGEHEIQFTKVGIKTWRAKIDLDEGDAMAEQRTGPTQLVAAMRCYVAAKLGNEFDLPRQLMSPERAARSEVGADGSSVEPGQ